MILPCTKFITFIISWEYIDNIFIKDNNGKNHHLIPNISFEHMLQIPTHPSGPGW